MNLDLTNFNKISPEKQKTVINAGFLCFGQNGYRKASVADIAKSAGISKASLFQYFGTKQDMYLFLYDFAGREMSRRQPKGTTDYFECAEMYVKTMAEVSRDYPNFFDFLILQAQRRDFADVEGILDVAGDVCVGNMDTIFADVDWAKFRDGWNKETVSNFFNFLSSGCIAELSDTMDAQKVYDEMLKYLGLLRQALYKPEFL